MRYARSVLLAAMAVGLLAFPASAETIATMDGHYYKLVPLKGIPRYPSEVVTVIPEGATASVPQASLSQNNSSCAMGSACHGMGHRLRSTIRTPVGVRLAANNWAPQTVPATACFFPIPAQSCLVDRRFAYDAPRMKRSGGSPGK
jgi:hypothetical protein